MRSLRNQTPEEAVAEAELLREEREEADQIALPALQQLLEDIDKPDER